MASTATVNESKLIPSKTLRSAPEGKITHAFLKEVSSYELLRALTYHERDSKIKTNLKAGNIVKSISAAEYDTIDLSEEDSTLVFDEFYGRGSGPRSTDIKEMTLAQMIQITMRYKFGYFCHVECIDCATGRLLTEEETRLKYCEKLLELMCSYYLPQLSYT